MPRPPMEAPTRTGSPLPGERRCHRGAGRRGRPILGAQSPRYEAVSAVAAVPALHKSSISADVLSPFDACPSACSLPIFIALTPIWNALGLLLRAAFYVRFVCCSDATVDYCETMIKLPGKGSASSTDVPPQKNTGVHSSVWALWRIMWMLCSRDFLSYLISSLLRFRLLLLITFTSKTYVLQSAI